MRYFCRFFLIIFLVSYLQPAYGQMPTCHAFPSDTIVVCPKDTPNFILSPAFPGATSYLWSTGQTTPGINIKNKGKYWVQITSPSGTCADTILIGVWGEGNAGNYQWYFGNNTGLDFSYGNNPVVITGSLNAPAGTSSISDPTGHLLFYTDGTTVYNQNNTAIGNLGGNSALTQSSIIVPSQQKNNIYTVFAVGSNGLRFDSVDISQNNGLGAASANTFLNSVNSAEVAAVYDSAGGFWVATDSVMGSGSYMLAYHITTTGIVQKPVVSAAGAGPGATLKFSDDGEEAAEAIPGSNEVIVYSFNKQTGAFTVKYTLTNINSPYALEFSQDGSKLYVSTGSSGHLYGYDLTMGSSALVNSARYLLTNDSTIGYYAMQLAPNGTIYIATDNGYLSTIGAPTEDSAGVQFENGSVSLNGYTSKGLPNFVSNYYTSSQWQFSYGGGCAGQVTTWFGQAPDSVYEWDVSVGSVLNFTAFETNYIDTSYTFTVPNAYSATIKATYYCYNTSTGTNTPQNTTVYDTIVIYQTPTPPRVVETLCNTPSYTLHAGTYYAGSASVGSSPISYTWTNKAAVTLGTDSILSVDTSGTYYVNINNNGCLGANSDSITFDSIPTNFLGNDTTLCTGKTDTLRVPLIVGATQAWNTGAISASIIVTSNTDSIAKYTVALKTSACTVKDSVTVTFIQVPTVNLGPNLTLCDGTTETLDAQNPGYNYLWSTGNTSEKIKVITTGTYYVTVYLGACGASDTVSITYEAYPVINLPSEEVYCSTEQSYVNLYGGQAASYLWLPGGQTTDSIQVSTPGTYIVQAFSAVAKCQTTDSVKVESICTPHLFVPTAFSPNGDGKNDIFQIYGNNILTYDMRVFDKWGELIFVSNDLTTSWDGTYRDQPVEQDVYTWKIIYTGQSSNGTISQLKEGSVTVLK